MLDDEEEEEDEEDDEGMVAPERKVSARRGASPPNSCRLLPIMQPFVIETNPRENRFLMQQWLWWAQQMMGNQHHCDSNRINNNNNNNNNEDSLVSPQHQWSPRDRGAKRFNSGWRVVESLEENGLRVRGAASSRYPASPTTTFSSVHPHSVGHERMRSKRDAAPLQEGNSQVPREALSNREVNESFNQLQLKMNAKEDAKNDNDEDSAAAKQTPPLFVSSPMLRR